MLPQVNSGGAEHHRISQGVEPPGEAVGLRAGCGQGAPIFFQLGGDCLPALGGRGNIVISVGAGGLLDQQFVAKLSLPGGGLRLRQLPPADGAGTQGRVGGGDVKGGGSETADLQ